jgi:hypothetical protein
MKEVIEFRISNVYAHLLLKPGEGKRYVSNTIIHITRDDPKFERIKVLEKQIMEKYNDYLFTYSNIKRKYSKTEYESAVLMQLIIKTTFEPAGEEYGTLYDESTACHICGANRTQLSPLTLKKGSIPKKDIARTIAGEVIVSEKFVDAFKKRSMKGVVFNPIICGKGYSGYYQVSALAELELSAKTIAGVNLFDYSEGNEAREFTIAGGYPVKFEKEIYKCPKGHTIGLNLLSESHVLNNESIREYDFFASKQKIGVKRGLLRPEPIYFSSPSFREMIIKEKLSGFDFEVAHIQ